MKCPYPSIHSSPKATTNTQGNFRKTLIVAGEKFGQSKLGKGISNVTEKIGNRAKPDRIIVTPEGFKVSVSHVPEEANTLYNTMGKAGNNHTKKPSFKDIQSEVKNAKPKGTGLSNKIIKKGPQGIYEDASYHHKNSSGIKSPAPTDGQQALDVSLKIEGVNSPTRIAISNDEFVVLMKHETNKFHGHVRE